MNTYWAILNLYTGQWEPIDAEDAALFCTCGMTIRLMDESEGA